MKHKTRITEQEQKFRLKRQQQEKGQAKNGGMATADQLGADATLLQNRLGNSGVSRMLAPSEQREGSFGGIDQIMNRPVGGANTIQRDPLPDDPKARQAEIKKRVAAGKKRRAQEKKDHPDNGWFGKNTKLGKAAYGLFGFSKGEGQQKDDDDAKKSWVGYDEAKEEKDRDDKYEIEKEFGNLGENELENDEKEEKKDEAEIFSIKKIHINIKDVNGKKEGKLGEAEGKAGAKANIEGVEGEAEVEWQFGKDGKLVKDNKHPWDIENKILSTKSQSEITGFMGAKAEGKAKAGLNWAEKSAAAKGKAAAFVGGSVEGKTEVNVTVGGVDALKTTGTLGATWGAGGEFEFKIGWAGGKFTAGGKAKAALGMGFSAGYEVELDTKSIGSKLWSWFNSQTDVLGNADLSGIWA